MMNFFFMGTLDALHRKKVVKIREKDAKCSISDVLFFKHHTFCPDVAGILYLT